MLPSALLAAANELRIDTSSASLADPDTGAELPAVEAAQLSPKMDRVRHHLIPARTTTCVRAPCLKRQASVPISTVSVELAAQRLQPAPIHDRVASNPLPTSFAAPRNLSLAAGVRHVHFDESPPEEFYVLSGASYDRRPIKCTQGGSEFDMSLPPRSTSHNGDDSAEDDASSVDESAGAMESADEPAPDVGFFRDPTLENWACIKNGTVIASVGYQPRQQQSGLMASGKSLHFSALSSLQHASALASDESKTSSTGLDSSSLYKTNSQALSQKVSLPVHGFRSFGGLQNSLAPEVTSPAILAEPSPPPSKLPLSPETTPPTPRRASPDATPMPSPSLRKSIGAYASVGYFGINSDGSQPSSLSSGSVDNGLSVEPVLGAMEVLRDVPSPSAAEQPPAEVRSPGPARLPDVPSSASSTLAATPSMSDASTQQSTPRRVGMERRLADKETTRISTLQPPAHSHAGGSVTSPVWNSVLGVTSSPLSSRCSSVDPWSSLSSDGDCDGTESPGNENSWNSSNCTSPDLSPFEQIVEGLNGKPAGGSSAARALSVSPDRRVEPSAEADALHLQGEADGAAGSSWEHENTPKGLEFADEAKFSSSVETVHTTSWESRHVQAVASASVLAGLSSGEVSTSEATTPESSRRPSFHHGEMGVQRSSPRLRSSFGETGSALDHLDEDESQVMRVRSVSRDGHAKKKSTKCRFCRSLRQRLKGSSAESSAPTSSGGSAQMTDAESESAGASASASASGMGSTARASLHVRDLTTSSAEVSEMEEEERGSRSPISHLRASVRSLSIESSGTSRSRSRDGYALSHLGIGRETQHDRESSNSPAESCSESAYLSAGGGVASMCTCDKKREKERLKKKMRRERELERERDREWERDQAKGRQKKLFGESFGDADNSCLSALDGF